MPEGLNFSEILFQIKEGKKCARSGWNGKGMHVQAQFPDEHSKMTLPYIYITTVKGDRVPWLTSQTDLLSDDWFIVA